MTFPAEDLAWCRSQFDLLADGGIWGVPRSGLIFQRRAGALVLMNRIPFSEMAGAAELGLDVPRTEAELVDYQDRDFDAIAGRFRAAGIEVRKELPERGATHE